MQSMQGKFVCGAATLLQQGVHCLKGFRGAYADSAAGEDSQLQQ